MNRKDQIIDAVITRFQEDGFSNDLTITEIAKSVDIGKSTVYEYFKSKDELIKDALIKMFTCNTEKIISIDNIENMCFEEAFKTQIEILFQSASESRIMFEVFSKDFHSHPAIQRELMTNMHGVKEQIEQRFIMIMMKGITEGLIKMDMDPMGVNIMSGLVIGSLIRFSDSTSGLDLNDFVNKVYESVVKLGN